MGLSSPIVAIGASAGGLAAFTALLKALPAKPGMAFVLIQHLDPTHESALTALLSTATGMSVTEVSDGIPVEPNHVYIIPPNKSMTIRQGSLRLAPRSNVSGLQHPIDDFSIALAEERGNAAIGVVLSGTGSDGTYGLKAIKEAGGVTFAQDPKTAQWPAMPLSAITAGAADFVLSPKRIAAELARIGRHPYLTETTEVADGSVLNQICLILRSSVGVDFRLYKPATVRRRIARRMALQKIASLDKYARILRQNPEEAQVLADDIFIHVTHFFRDPEAFQVLRKRVLAKLRPKGRVESPLRIWVAGCSTGEEVYSIAMLLLEELGDQANKTKIQIFGTDIQERALQHARAGIYTEAAVAGVSPARMKRFFIQTEHGYQVQKIVRDLCVFARHDLAKDPPFSRLDLISCRNVLIYMGSALQKRILSLFQYALQPGGFLFLGNSESVGEYSDAFRAEDQKHRIFSRKPAVAAFGGIGLAPSQVEPYDTPPKAPGTSAALAFGTEAEALLLEHHAPPALVVDPDLHIVHFQGDTSPYLAPAAGQPSFHLLKMVRPEFVVDLRAAIYKARREGVAAHKDGVQFEHKGRPARARLEVWPLKKCNGKKQNFLVVFQKAEAASPDEEKPATATTRGKPAAGKVERFERELRSAREQLRVLIAEHETAQEEMKAANEEVLSSNEELQSSNEELETAKEELQSSNEELITLNDELQHRNAELSVLTQDLTNLLVGVDIPVLVLDADLRVRRFTPVAGTLLNLIPGDVGRPFSNIASNLDVTDWKALFAEVTGEGRSIQRDVCDRNGHRYSLRVRPYKTDRNEIGGVLVVLFDIDVLKNSLEQALIAGNLATEAQLRAQSIMDSLASQLAVVGPDGTILATNDAWNRFALENQGQLAACGPGANYLEVCRRSGEVAVIDGIQQVLQGHRGAFQLEYPCHSPFEQRWFLMNAAPLKGTQGGAVVTHVNITDRKLAEMAVLLSESTIRALLESTTQSIIAVDSSEKIVLANGSTQAMFGYPKEELIGQPLEILVPEGGRRRHAELHQGYFANMQSRPMGIGLELEGRRKDGSIFPAEIGLSAIETTATGKLAVAFVSDITSRKQAEEAIRESEERVRLAIGSTGLGTFDVDPLTGRGIGSDALKAHLGLKPGAEVDARTARKAISSGDWDRARRIVEEALRPESSGRFAMEFRTLGIDDGMQRWIGTWGKVFFDGQGRPTRVLGVTQDLTERKRMEESLRQHEQEISTVLDSSPDVIMRLDPQLRYSYVNAKTASIAGIPRDSFLGKTPAEVGLPPELVALWRNEGLRTFETGQPGNLEFSYPSPGGTTEWEERFIPEFAPDGSVASLLIIGRDVTEQKRLEKVAETTRGEIRALAASLLTAQEEERRRVSRELHDQTCQDLASLAIDMGELAAKPPPPTKAQSRIKALQARVVKASEMARHIAYQLHPSVLDDLGLVASLRSLCAEFSGRKGPKAEFTYETLPGAVPREIASCLYRVAQESLANIAKHSKAKHTTMALTAGEGTVMLAIADDGIGFDPAVVSGRGGLGLVGMKERARLVNGKLTIAAQPGHGTRIALEVPLREEEYEAGSDPTG